MLAGKCKQCFENSLVALQKLHRRTFYQTNSQLNLNVTKGSDEDIYTWVRLGQPLRLRLEKKRKPYIRAPHDVLIKVKAASVNPIDVAMTGGYGAKILVAYQAADEFCNSGPASLCQAGAPAEVLGRDFSGVVESVGHSVSRFKPGDEVYGATPAIKEGAHAEYTIASQDSIAIKPENLSHIEAASIPYAALTFLSAVDISGSSGEGLRNKRVCINAGAGGIGTFAIQYLKALQCEVTVSVSESGRALVSELNADHVLDYRSPRFEEELRELAGFDVAFDYAGDEAALSYVKPQGWFITSVSPLLKTVDDNGYVFGSLKASAIFAQKYAQVLYNYGVYYSWAFFKPNGSALCDIRTMIENEQIRPVIDEVFPFHETKAAYEKVSKGKGRGKVVIDVSNQESSAFS